MTNRPYRIAAYDVPIVLEVDVLVTGGGFAGVCAAVAAARAGAKVAVLERDGLLGGQAAEIYTFGLDAVFGDAGRQIIKGLPWEIIRRTAELGNADPSWKTPAPRSVHRQCPPSYRMRPARKACRPSPREYPRRSLRDACARPK